MNWNDYKDEITDENWVALERSQLVCSLVVIIVLGFACCAFYFLMSWPEALLCSACLIIATVISGLWTNDQEFKCIEDIAWSRTRGTAQVIAGMQKQEKDHDG